MNRADRRRRGERGPKEARAKPMRDLGDVTLRDMRFDTAESSQMFLNLRYFNPVFVGFRDDGIRLPPVDESVSTTSSSGGMVYKAFPHGLMYGDQLSMMAGGGLFLAALVILPFAVPISLGLGGPLSHFFTTISTGGVIDIIVIIMLYLLMLVFSPFIFVVIMGDLIGFRFETSALFDRNAGKVHLISDQSMPWAPWRYELKSYDWQCVRGEIDTVTLFTGPIDRKEAGLRCVIMDRPGGDTVIDQFVLGVTVPAQHIQPLIDTWEHVRRFMQREGPLFADQDDKPNTSLGRQPLWKHLLAGPTFQIWATKDMFKIAREDKSFLAAFAGFIGIVVGLPILVVTTLWGFLPWLSGLAKRDPTWPAEIIRSVGGASLNDKDLEAWRGVIPEPAHKLAILDVDRSIGNVHEPGA